MSEYQANIVIKNPATPTGPSPLGSAPGIWRLNDVAGWIKQGVWPDTNVDPYWAYLSLLLSTTSLSNANNNLFVDSSGAFNPVSRNGNTTQGSFTPYSTNWSNYFDGSGDYLTAPDNAALQLGSSDFTIEFWVNFTTVPGSLQGATLVSKFNTSNTGYEVILYNNTMYFQAQTANIGMTYAFTPTAGLWYHIAWTRSGANSYGFINGALVASTSAASGSITNLAQALQIGRRGDNTFYLTGYMSNVRVVKGTAVYTAAFTPPTSPLTAITNTSLLTCQSNRFRDASTNNFTITVNGNTSVQEFNPFILYPSGITYNQSDITNWSGYFDGSGDYLQTPSNSAFALNGTSFTIEAWVYVTSSSEPYQHVVKTSGATNNLMYIDYSGGSNGVLASQVGGTIASQSGVTLNTWHHLAVVRNGTSVTSYVNGVGGTPQTIDPGGSGSVSLIIATDGGPSPIRYFNGYISNLRVVKGTAVYTANFTPPTTNLTAISGTSLLTLQNAAFTDNSTNNFVITQNGNVTVTGNSPFNTVGYWSNYFDGTSDSLTYTGGSSLNFGTSDFTIELWAFLTNTGTFSPFIRPDDSGSFPEFGYDFSAGQLKFDARNAPIVAVTTTMPTNQWVHVAASRSGTSLRLFVNGTQVGSTTTNSTNFGSTTGTIRIGGSSFSTSHTVNGYLSNFRVIKGTALYTANFTPPTTPLTAITNTSLLTCQNGRFIDNSTNAFTITANGNTSIQSFDPFYTATIASNGGSMYFDGSGDYLSLPDSPSLQMGSGNFTVEYWWYPVSIAGYQTPFEKGYTGSGGLLMQTGNGDGIIYVYASGSAVITASTAIGAGRWNHVALVRNGTSLVLYLNGVSIGSATNSTNFNNTGVVGIGANVSGGGAGAYPINGYMSDVRVTKGTAVYTATFTPPTAPVTPTAATTLLVNGMNAGIYDATAINDMETVGNAQVTTAVSKYGGSSVYFDGSGDGLKFPSNVAMAMGTGNFTWELWVRATAASGYQSLIDTRTAVLTDGFFFGLDTGTLRPAVFTNGTVLVSSTSLTANTWQHLALVRSSGTLTIYLDGTSIGSVANSTNLTSGVGTIGSSDSISNPNWFNGYIDDLRVTRGVARYTSNFTPPTQAFPVY